MKTYFKLAASAALFGAAMLTVAYPSAASDVPALRAQPAERSVAAEHVRMLGAARAGNRIVAVGDHGVVLLSDDNGAGFRQAGSVPGAMTLNAVSFVDASTGWAVGHWGAIMKTTDGGEHWALQRMDTKVDQPLFSVYFKNATEGWAVGLWSLMLHTTDGGHSWSVVNLPKAEKGKVDRNFYSIFADAKGNMFIACEQGRVMRSTTGGDTWEEIDTGYAGSFWSGVALDSGTLVVGGLRGTVYRSVDGGSTWQPSKMAVRSSITGMVENPDKSIAAVALDGVLHVSRDDGVSFSANQRPDRVNMTAVVVNAAGKDVLFSIKGPMDAKP